MFERLTYKWAETLVALIAVAMIPIPYVGLCTSQGPFMWITFLCHRRADTFLLWIENTTTEPCREEDPGDRRGKTDRELCKVVSSALFVSD